LREHRVGTVSNPPTQADVQAIASALDDIRARLIKGRSTKGVAFPAEAR
jgi:hypothetical protein